MTWLEIMDILDRMPRHLLKREAELWHYDDGGNCEILPIDDSVSPLNDSAPDGEWAPGGDCRLSLQSFDVDRKPKLNELQMSERRKEEFERAMNTVCGECGNDGGQQCDDCWVRRTWERMNAPKLNEYVVKVHRVCNVSVMAESEEQARQMGESLAEGRTEIGCYRMNETMTCAGDDEFCGIGTPNDHVSLSFDAEDSKRLLNEEE